MPAIWLAVGCSGNGGEEGEKQEQAAEEPTQESTEILLGGGQATPEKATPEEDEEEETEEPVFSKVQAERMYVGRVEGTDAFIGIAVREETNEVIAYDRDGLPEGPPEAATIDAWFQGPIEGDEVSLTADSGEERLQALLSAETVTGAFTETDGQTHVFEAEPVDVEGDAGLYWSQPVEGEGLSSRGGTIIQADGEERGTNTFTCQANKVCVGTNKTDTIRAKGGDDTISDGPDEDNIQGGPGSDTINGGSSDEASTSETELLQDDAGPRNGNPADVDRIFAGQETTSVFDGDTEDLLDCGGDFASVAADPGGDEIANCSK